MSEEVYQYMQDNTQMGISSGIDTIVTGPAYTTGEKCMVARG